MRRAKAFKDSAAVEMGFAPVIDQHRHWHREQRAINQLIDYHFARDGADVVPLSDEPREETIEQINLQTFVRPKRSDHGALSPIEPRASSRPGAKIENRQ